MTSLVARAWRQTLILACAVLLLAIAPGHAEDRSVLRREIEAMHVRYLDAFNHRDAAALGALFAENGIFVDPAGKVANAAHRPVGAAPPRRERQERVDAYDRLRSL